MSRHRPRKFIKGTGIKRHKGALHRALGIPAGRRISDAELASAARRPGHVGHMARFAQTLRTFRHHHSRRRRAHHSRSR